MTWSPWSSDSKVPPIDFGAVGTESNLQVEFNFSTFAKQVTPKLKSFDVAFRCVE